VSVLAGNPLAEGDYYPGDLLDAVVRLPKAAWHGTAGARDRLTEIVQATPLAAEDIEPGLRVAVTAFRDSS
jgi:hypothetical protein